MATWEVTQGEVLHNWLCEVLPRLLRRSCQDARARAHTVIAWFRDAHMKVWSLKRVVQEPLAASFDAHCLQAQVGAASGC